MRTYDELTEKHFNDPVLIWQDTISGKKTFDSCDFLGALKNLSGIPNWQEAFEGLENGQGFIERLADFFAQCQDDLDAGNGQSYLYFFPRPKQCRTEKRVKLATQAISEYAKLAKHIGESKLSDRLQQIPILSDNGILPNDLHIEIKPGFATDFYDILGDAFIHNKFPGWSHIHWCLSEACYGLAADDTLERYLLQEFYALDFNHSYQHALEWEFGGWFQVENERIIVGARS